MIVLDNGNSISISIENRNSNEDSGCATHISINLLLFRDIDRGGKSMKLLKTIASSVFVLLLMAFMLLPGQSVKAASDEGITLKNVSSNSGKNSGTGERFYYSVYLKEGESLTLTAKYKSIATHTPNTEPAEGHYSILTPSGTKTTLAFPKGKQTAIGVFVPDAVDGEKQITILAEETGIYLVKPVQEWVQHVTSYDLTFKVFGDSGNHIPGRVWSDNIELEQWSGRNASTGEFRDLEDYTFYHLTSDGYLYKQQLMGFHGITSYVHSDPVGTMSRQNMNCESAYRDTPSTATTLYTTLSANSSCNSRIKKNHVFLEYPDASLPTSATTLTVDFYGNPKTNDSGNLIRNTVFVYPVLADNQPEFANFTFDRDAITSNKGTFEFDVKNHQGFVNLMIHIDRDNDGTFESTVSREILANQNGKPTKFSWDGKDDNGIDVLVNAKIRAELMITKRGEIHFVNSDVETRTGMSVTQLNAMLPENVNNSVLHYDASHLPIDWARVQNYTRPTVESGSYDSVLYPQTRSWKQVSFVDQPDGDPRNTFFPRLSEYEGRPTDESIVANHVRAYGDGYNMDEWMYENLEIRAELELEIGEPKVSISKAVSHETAIVGDELTYTLRVKNESGFDVTNYTVVDTIDNPLHVAYVADSAFVDGVSVTDSEDADNFVFDANTLTVDLPFIAKDAEIEITFKVKVLKPAEKHIVVNTGYLIDNENPENPTPSEEVETEILYYELIAAKSVVDESGNHIASDNERLTYTIEVTNIGNTTANNVSIKDALERIQEKATITSLSDVTVNVNGVVSIYTFEDLRAGTINVDIAPDVRVTVSFDISVVMNVKGETDLENIAVVTPEDGTPLYPEAEIPVITEVPPVTPETPIIPPLGLVGNYTDAIALVAAGLVLLIVSKVFKKEAV